LFQFIASVVLHVPGLRIQVIFDCSFSRSAFPKLWIWGQKWVETLWPGRTIRNPTLVRRIMHINEVTTGLCIIMSVHVTIF